jgi:hypothetical protein
VGTDYGDTFTTSYPTTAQFGFSFTYYGVAITQANIWHDGDLYLFTASNAGNYHLAVYLITGGYSGTSAAMYRAESTQYLLSTLSSQVSQASGTSFMAQDAFVITYYNFANNVVSSLLNSFQLVLVTDGTYSYLVYNYERLDNTAGSQIYYKDNTGAKNTLNVSVTGSNCNQPGRYIYRVDGRELIFDIKVKHFYKYIQSEF